MIIIIDFGSQTTHLIGRRLKDMGVTTLIIDPEKAISEIKKNKPMGIILSGGPSSVYEKGAPMIDNKIYDFAIPMLGICYGFQLTAQQLGGKVVSGKKEYGPATLNLTSENQQLNILRGVPTLSTIWMSHGDTIVNLPNGFKIIGSTDHVSNAAAVWLEKKLYMLQFHPEIEHTQYGNQILENFVQICGLIKSNHTIYPQVLIQKIRETVKDAYVIGAISGGVDSSVAGTLVAKAIGKKFIPIFVDNGLMRPDAALTVKKIFISFEIKPKIVDVQNEMLRRLHKISDSEKKRKVIGAFYIEVFERELKRLTSKGLKINYLLQGTIFSDVIESKGSRHASKIKSHHNVGGLPNKMKLKLLEPLRDLYKDEVRALGRDLDLPDEFIAKQVFPGPGYAVRIRGEVTNLRLKQLKQADAIVLEELQQADWLKKVYMSFPVMTGAESTAVKGDGRSFCEVIALRVIESKDVMSTNWSKLPYELLQKISSRIVNEVPGISRVVYDITTKPPATMEWE